MPDPFAALHSLIDYPPAPLDGAPGRARRLMIQATLGASETDELAREIDAFQSDYQMLCGTIELAAPSGPMGGANIDLGPLQDMLRARLERIMQMCMPPGTVR